MHKVIHDVNAYVEEGKEYMTDSVLITLTETKSEGGQLTKVVVESYPANTDGQKMQGASPLTVKDFGTDLKSAIAYYNSIEHQLSMGDRIRNV